MNTDWLIAGLILTIFGLITYYFFRGRTLNKTKLGFRLKPMAIDQPPTGNQPHLVFVEGPTKGSEKLFFTVRLGGSDKRHPQLRLCDPHYLLTRFEGRWAEITVYNGRLVPNAVVVRARLHQRQH